MTGWLIYAIPAALIGAAGYRFATERQSGGSPKADVASRSPAVCLGCPTRLPLNGDGDFGDVDGIEWLRGPCEPAGEVRDLFPEDYENAKRLMIDSVEHFRSFLEDSGTVRDIVDDVLCAWDELSVEADIERAVDERRIDEEAERAA